jgi:hypothetical protein
LTVVIRDSAAQAAGPSVSVDPHAYIDEPIVFREYFCPCCSTRLQCGLVPRSHIDVIGGFRVRA